MAALLLGLFVPRQARVAEPRMVALRGCPLLDVAIDDTLWIMSSVEEQIAGALLVSARVRHGLSQTAFADLLGIAQPTLSAYESGRRQPTVPTLLRLLGRAGLELRMELVEQDRHDATLAQWEESLTDAERSRLESQGYRLVSARG